MDKKFFEGVQAWMHRNARPLDMARWKFLFENGSREEVLEELRFYQNQDGGFGHGLEEDCLNPESSPMQTWAATEILYELGNVGCENPIVKGILKYLEDCPYYIDSKWIGTIPSNNDHPHAPWWNYSEETVKAWNWNPTACLTGFVLCYADKDRKVYKMAEQSASEAYQWFMAQEKMESMHETLCFMRLYEYCVKAKAETLFDMERFKEQLKKQVSLLIERNTSLWKTEYVCRPSFFISSRDSFLYKDNSDIVDKETEYLTEAVNSEGVWSPTWQWSEYPEEWAVCKRWWQASIAIGNMKFMKAFDKQ